jgi:hypothetical protein
MKGFFLLITVSLFFCSFGQKRVLFTGNTSSICYTSKDPLVVISEELPDSLLQFDVIFIFSTARSSLSKIQVEELIDYLNHGKGLYLGSENWPLQAESNQLTDVFYTKRSWGHFTEEKATVADSGILSGFDTIHAGTSTVAFPLDYRLKVEAWIADEPLILSGEQYGGRIILDGGYSRFYCAFKNEDSDLILQKMIEYLD